GSAQATADTDPSVREAAAVALSKIDGRTKPDARPVAVEVAVPAYQKMLASKDVASRRVAAVALGNLIRSMYAPPWRRCSSSSPSDDFFQLSQAVGPTLAGSPRGAEPDRRRPDRPP